MNHISLTQTSAAHVVDMHQEVPDKPSWDAQAEMKTYGSEKYHKLLIASQEDPSFQGKAAVRRVWTQKSLIWTESDFFALSQLAVIFSVLQTLDSPAFSNPPLQP